MDNKRITEVVAWIKTHPDHVHEDSVEFIGCGTPAATWFYFVSHPLMICEYEDPESYQMLGNKVENGCALIFGSGSLMGMRCDGVPVTGKNRCAFHDCTIFSDKLRAYIMNQHLDVNCVWGTPFTLWQPISPKPEMMPQNKPSPIPEVISKSTNLLPLVPGTDLVAWCKNRGIPVPDQQTLIPGVAPESTTPDVIRGLMTRPFGGTGLYREITHGLIVRRHMLNIPVECLGYAPGRDSNILPLTPELRTWCQEQDIRCI